MRQNPRLAHHRRSSQSGPPTTIYNRFVRWARRGIWENLFRELAGNGRSVDTQMIDSTHVKAHRSASGGKGGSRSRLLAEPIYRPYDRRDRGPSVDLGPNIRLDFGDRGPRYRTRDRCRDYDDC